MLRHIQVGKRWKPRSASCAVTSLLRPRTKWRLVETQRRAAEYAKRDGLLAEDEPFYAKQNAVAVNNTERYYREMFAGRPSWNLRDPHMVDTLAALAQHLGRARDGPAKIVASAHNSHLGDARATEMGSRWN